MANGWQYWINIIYLPHICICLCMCFSFCISRKWKRILLHRAFTGCPCICIKISICICICICVCICVCICICICVCICVCICMCICICVCICWHKWLRISTQDVTGTSFPRPILRSGRGWWWKPRESLFWRFSTIVGQRMVAAPHTRSIATQLCSAASSSFPPHPMPSSPVTVIPSVCTSPPVQAARVASAHGISDFWPGKVTKAGGRQVAGEGGGAGADAPGQVAAGGVAVVVGARCKVATCRCFPPRERVNPLHKTISPAYFCYII